MISCEDVLSDKESDTHIEFEDQKYVDSDRADSDIEIELYSQIHFTEDLNATAPVQSFGNNSSYIFDVTPVKSLDFLSFKSQTEIPCDVKQETSEIMKLNHFESSTPKTSLKNNLILRKKISKSVVGNKVKLPRAKSGKRKVSLASGKSSKDSGCSESVTCTVNHDGDDSDESVVILDTPDVVTNVESKEVVVLDSSATSDDSVGHNSASSELSDSDDLLKLSVSAPGSVAITNVVGASDLWHIDHEDRFAFIKKQKRYHEKHSSICNNCKKKGHLSKDCAEPRNTKCYICGRDHVWSMCHRRMCGYCLEYGHGPKKCRYKVHHMLCNLCKMRGHTMHECPDLWRRYHLTTSPGPIVKGPKEVTQGVKKYCYNCGHEGHYGHECLKPRMQADTFPTWPTVVSYKDPYHHLKKHSKKNSIGESSNSSRHNDSYSRRKYNKKYRGHADEWSISEKRSEVSKKRKNKQKDKTKFQDERDGIPLLKGNDFPRSSSIIVLDEDSHKNKKKKKRDIDKLFSFKRKKQKLNVTL